MTGVLALVDRLDGALPQTQCRRCGYPSCRAYAQAIAEGAADIDRCPPGGGEGVNRLAHIAGRPSRLLNPECGVEGPLRVAWIHEAHCIGCTLCIAACPVDCIVGAPKRMHTVVESQCTGCELCVPACPVDCIALEVTTPGRSGWQAWSVDQARESKARFDARSARRERLARQAEEHLSTKTHRVPEALGDLAVAAPEDTQAARKRALVETALRRARERLVPASASSDASDTPDRLGTTDPKHP